MGLNKSSGNMYGFVSHTFNIIKGVCMLLCLYCYMRKIAKKDKYFDFKELNTDLGSGNFIFVGSGIDMWAPDIPDEWITMVLDYLEKFNNKYLLQSKNPSRFIDFINHPVMQKSIFCTTIESNRVDCSISKAPPVQERAEAMNKLHELGFETMVTAEPIMDFDIEPMAELLRKCHPSQINIGFNTNKEVDLDEPSIDKCLELVRILRDNFNVKLKRNASRLIK